MHADMGSRFNAYLHRWGLDGPARTDRTQSRCPTRRGQAISLPLYPRCITRNVPGSESTCAGGNGYVARSSDEACQIVAIARFCRCRRRLAVPCQSRRGAHTSSAVSLILVFACLGPFPGTASAQDTSIPDRPIDAMIAAAREAYRATPKRVRCDAGNGDEILVCAAFTRHSSIAGLVKVSRAVTSGDEAHRPSTISICDLSRKRRPNPMPIRLQMEEMAAP